MNIRTKNRDINRKEDGDINNTRNGTKNEEGKRMNDDDDFKIVATKCAKRTGNSLVVYLTNEMRLLGINEGDRVEVTIRRVNE